MIRLARDCVIATVAYAHIAVELLCPTLLSALRDKNFDKHEAAE